MDLDLADLVVGLVGGFTLSVIGWLVNAHWVVPRVEFGDDLLLAQDTQEFPVLLMRVTNKSRFRSIIDLEMHVILRIDTSDIAAAVRLDPTRSNYFDQDFTTQRRPVLEHGKTAVLSFRVDVERFPLARSFVECREPETPVGIVGHLFAYDSLSGSRKLFVSKVYVPDEDVSIA